MNITQTVKAPAWKIALTALALAVLHLALMPLTAMMVIYLAPYAFIGNAGLFLITLALALIFAADIYLSYVCSHGFFNTRECFCQRPATLAALLMSALSAGLGVALYFIIF